MYCSLDQIKPNIPFSLSFIKKSAYKSMLSVLMLSGVILPLSGCMTSGKDYAGYVNPLIGTLRGNGSTYPGAQGPFGMVSFSPHTEERNHGSGYHYDCDKIRSFGMVHISGVGCEAVCELPFMPVTEDLSKSPVGNKNVYSSLYNHDTEKAEPGYYAVSLDRYNVDVELSATTRCGIAEFNYPAGQHANLVFDAGGSANGMKDGSILIDPSTRTLSGWVRGGGFCNQMTSDYVIYFNVIFDKPFMTFGSWQGDKKNAGQAYATGKDIAAYISFDPSVAQNVTMKAGISYVSLENAKENLNIEIPGWELAKVAAKTRAAWNKELNKVDVEGGSIDDTTIFYTALYHSIMLPNIFDDANGEYMGMDDKVYTVRPGHHVYTTFSGWDTYRSQAQLWGLLYPEAGSDFCQTLLDSSRQTEYKGGGGLPLWSMFNDETLIMAGYPADPFIANAYAFGAKDFDVDALTEVMIDSGKENRYWGRNLHMTWAYLDDYKKYGYYPYDCGIPCAISQSVEYSVADFSIAQMCKAIGDEDNYQYYLERSQGIFNIMHPEKKYLWPKMKDGSWKPNFDPFTGDGCQEGTSTHYTWGIPHNLGKLVQMIGGEAKAQERLDKLMSDIAFGYDYGNPLYLAGNEPCFGVVPVYNWMGAPWKTQKEMRHVMDASFSNKVAGIPGDDDSGAMSAWYVFAAMGLYPEIPGVGGFAVTGPLFEKITLNLDSGKKIVISAENAGQESPYITNMKLNGEDCEKSWLTIEELTSMNVSNLDFVMSTEPNKDWAKDYCPPSFE